MQTDFDTNLEHLESLIENSPAAFLENGVADNSYKLFVKYKEFNLYHQVYAHCSLYTHNDPFTFDDYFEDEDIAFNYDKEVFRDSGVTLLMLMILWENAYSLIIPVIGGSGDHLGVIQNSRRDFESMFSASRPS